MRGFHDDEGGENGVQCIVHVVVYVGGGCR